MARSTVNVDVQIQTKSIDQLEKELAGINEQLKKADIGSKAFTDLSTKAQGLTKELNKANAAAEGFTDDKKFMAADGAIKAMAGSVTGVVGALGLLGVESEAFGEMEKKAASAIAVAIGIKDVSEGFNQLRKSQVLATTATKAYNLAVSAGNKIMKLFNITMALNPIGVFIAALTAVGALIYAFRDNIKNLIDAALGPLGSAVDFVADKLTKLGQALGVLATDEEKAIQKTIDGLERQLAVRSARGEDTLELEKKILKEKRKLLEKGTKEYEENLTAQMVINARIQKQKDDQQAEQDAKDKAARDKKIADKKAQDEKDKADADAKAKEDADREKARVASIESILDSFVTRQEDKDADTRQKKIDLEEERKLEDLERLGATDAEINEAKDFYAGLRKEAEILDKEESDEKKATEDKEEFDRIKEQEEKKLSIKLASLDTMSELFGQETALGKAALLAKQFLLAQEMILDIKGTLAKGKKAVTDAAITGTGASTEVAGSVAKASNTAPPPFNIPFILTAITTGASILASVKSAIGATKQAAGVGGSTPSLTAPNASTSNIGNQLGPAAVSSLPPQPSLVNKSVRAYVISGDVSSSQEADARLDRRRSLG